MPRLVLPRLAIHRVATLPDADQAEGALLRTGAGLFFSDGSEWHAIVEFVVTAPVNTLAPVVSGTAVVGNTLTTSNGTWAGNPSPTFSYQWQLDETDIPGETATTYEITDPGLIRCVVTGTNGQGDASANSNEVTATESSGSVSIGGHASASDDQVITATQFFTESLNTTAGSTLVGFVVSRGDYENTTHTFADNLGNTYTQVLAIPGYSSGVSITATVWICTDGTRGEFMYAIGTTSDNDGYPSGSICEVIGGVLDQSASAGDTATPFQAGSVTPTEDGSVVLCFLGTDAYPPPTIGISGGPTILESYLNSENQFASALAGFVQATAAAVDPSWTCSSSPTICKVATVTFKPA